jgi:ubiquinone/menaquinone biosynthesis C-methylase UbiE
VAVHKRTHQEKLARIYDDQIAPVWGSRFGKMLLRNLAVPEKGQILDISCGTGYPLVEVLRRKSDGTRVIAIDASSAMLDIARRKVADLGGKGVFFRTESPLPRLSFADDVYDLVLCNLGLAEMPNLKAALNDFARVTKLGGEVRCTLPLAGTWQELLDVFREVLVKHDKHEALDRLDRHVAAYPTVDDCCGLMLAAGLEPTVEVEEFSLLFKSSREFFFAPVIEYGPLPEWKEIAGSGQELQDVFWYIKEAIDAYFGERAFQVTVKAGCLIGRKRTLEPEEEMNTGRVELFDTLDSPEPPRPSQIADGSVRDSGTAEVDVAQILEADGSGARVDYEAIALDAFGGGERPEYLEAPPRRQALIVDDGELDGDGDGGGDGDGDPPAIGELAARAARPTLDVDPLQIEGEASIDDPGVGDDSGSVDVDLDGDDGVVDGDPDPDTGRIHGDEFGDDQDTDGGPVR